MKDVGKCFGQFDFHFVYFGTRCGHFGIFSTVLVRCTKKNLATLSGSRKICLQSLTCESPVNHWSRYPQITWTLKLIKPINLSPPLRVIYSKLDCRFISSAARTRSRVSRLSEFHFFYLFRKLPIILVSFYFSLDIPLSSKF
jgi:hypothetical protein